MKTLTLPDGRTLTYELTRKRVKNINFRPKEDGIVYVSANSRATMREIEQFLRDRADFFFGAFEKLRLREEKSDVNEDSVTFMGRRYPLRVIQNARETAVLDENECRVFTRLGDDAPYVLELVRNATRRRFREICRDVNAEVLEELAQSGLEPPPTRITIKDMLSRWGSCSYTRGNISINSRLAAYPRETVKAVFWHEYAHYWHHDHSKSFYAFLEQHYPEYFKWHKFLKE